jgi:hypothetical protein
LRLDLKRSTFLDLGPWPDATEYFAGAVSLVRDGRYSIEIGDQPLPPRYPYGYSLAIASFLLLAPEEQAVVAPFRVNQLLGALTLVGVFLFLLRSRAQPLAAAVGVLLVATFPSFLIFARAPLSELLGTSLLLAACACFEIAAVRRSPLVALLGAAVLGSAVTVRLALVLFAPLLLLAALATRRTGWAARLLLLAGCGLVLVSSCAPLLLYQWSFVGSPLSTGYDFWVPRAISLDHLERPAAHARELWQELTLSRAPYRVSNMFGTGAYVTPALLMLAAMAPLRTLRSRRGLVHLAAATVYVAGVAVSSPFPDLRLWFPLIMMAIVAAASLAQEICRRSWWPRWQRVAFGLLIVSSVAGYPVASGYPPRIRMPHQIDILRMRSWYGPSPRYAAAMEFRRRHDAGGPLVVSPISPTYLSSLLAPATGAIPDQTPHQYSHSRRFPFGVPEILSAQRAAIASGRRVFHLAPAGEPDVAQPPSTATPDGFAWRRLSPDSPSSVVHELVRLSDAPPPIWEGEGLRR